MKNLDVVAKELFNKIRGRFPSVTVGNESAEITNDPNEGRFFEFDFTNGKKVSISVDDKQLTIMYGKNLFGEDEEVLKGKWYDFLKEMRAFARKRMLNFDTRDITKNNLDKRDYEYLSTEKTMSESKLYGTSRTSYQDIGTARMIVKHSAPINQESVTGRNTNIHSIYIESEGGERFKYPYKHMNGARAMARHVSEGGNPYDEFGKHISGLSEELSNLRKFKTYMNRSNVMAEGLSQYMDVVNDRIETVKKTVESIQKQSGYAKTFEGFESTVLEEVPEDVTANWIDELTIRQFNEELKNVFPYIYKLVSEANAVKEIGPDDLLGEYDDEEPRSECCDAPLLNYNDGLGICSDCKEHSGPIDDYEDDGQPSSYDEYQDLYGGDDDFGGYDMESSYEEHLDNIIKNAKHEKDPMEDYNRAFEDFKMAAANAAAKGEPEFEYPAGSGKKHKSTMSKATAAKMLADSSTNESQINEISGILKQIAKGASSVAGKMGPGAKTGLDSLVKAGKAGAGSTAANVAGKVAKGAGNAAKGALATAAKRPVGTVAVGTGAGLGMGAYDAVTDVGDAITDFTGTMADKIPDVDDIKAMLPNIPNAEELAGIAKQYALPAAAVLAALYLGYKGINYMFGDNEKESSDTIDLSPKGKGDEMKQKNEIPLDEFVKSLYDYTTNSFPKGETAVLTQVQKQYGDEAIDEAQSVMQELMTGQDEEMARIQHLAGLR